MPLVVKRGENDHVLVENGQGLVEAAGQPFEDLVSKRVLVELLRQWALERPPVDRDQSTTAQLGAPTLFGAARLGAFKICPLGKGLFGGEQGNATVDLGLAEGNPVAGFDAVRDGRQLGHIADRVWVPALPPLPSVADQEGHVADPQAVGQFEKEGSRQDLLCVGVGFDQIRIKGLGRDRFHDSTLPVGAAEPPGTVQRKSKSAGAPSHTCNRWFDVAAQTQI